MRFAQYAKQTASRILFDEAADLVLRQAARFGNPWNLEESGGCYRVAGITDLG